MSAATLSVAAAAVATAAIPAVPTMSEPSVLGRPQLAVRFAPDRGGRTYLASQRATHPYHLCRALYDGADPPGFCTLYSQGCSGGLFEGDRVSATFSAAPGSRAHVTTGAATIVHRMPGDGWAEQNVRVEVAAGALLELMPDPLILFPGSRLKGRLQVRLEAGAHAIVVDSFLVHQLLDDSRPFEFFENDTRIEDADGRLLARERIFATGHYLRKEAGAQRRWRAQGTVMVLGAGEKPLSVLRSAIDSVPGIYGGASTMPDAVGVFGRLLATDGVALRAGLGACWRAARAGIGLPPGRPRRK